MSLNPGAALGPYEIIALIGAGRMGSVYRARDTTLDRDVAIKVLLGAVARLDRSDVSPNGPPEILSFSTGPTN
jgi:serine/threonine protein kinase